MLGLWIVWIVCVSANAQTDPSSPSWNESDSVPLAIPKVSVGSPEWQALMDAVRHGQVEWIRELASSKRWDFDQRDPEHNGWTPLMLAVHVGERGSMRALLSAGASVDASGNDGTTPLLMAAGYGYADMVETMLERGADPKRLTSYGGNALSLAVGGATDIDRFTVFRCQTETVRILLEHDPDLVLPKTWDGRLARFKARLCRCGEIRDMLDGR